VIAREKKQPTFIWFLDIDGTISIPNLSDANERFEVWNNYLPAWPIPMANTLLQALDKHPAIHPVWLSAWDNRAWLWNDRAGTRHFPVAYYLSYRQRRYAQRYFCHPPHLRMDSKLFAVCYYLRKFQECEVVWMEDGFAPETYAWANYARTQGQIVHLIDTNIQPTLSLLRHHHQNLEAQTYRFMHWCLTMVS